MYQLLPRVTNCALLHIDLIRLCAETIARSTARKSPELDTSRLQERRLTEANACFRELPMREMGRTVRSGIPVPLPRRLAP
jgi:hypothetical protein